MNPPRRGRGRPPGGDSAERTRQAIIEVARRQFAERGFRGASVRAIAGEAGVDPSLINHHFGDKAQLLVATMELPFNPLERVSGVLDGPLEGMAARLIRTFCESWDPYRDVFSTLIRSSLDGGLENSQMLELARNVIIRQIAEKLDGDDAPARAGLVASQLIGLAIMRYLARLEPVASLTVDELVVAYAPGMQLMMTPGSSASSGPAR